MKFTSDNVFTYNEDSKRRYAITFYAVMGVLAVLIFLSVFTDFGDMLRSQPAIDGTISFVTNSFKEPSPLSIFLIGFVGGLFFLTLPLEVLFLAQAPKIAFPYLSVPLVILGILLSYTFNYYAGRWMSKIVQPLIGPKKFYSLKSKTNKYGGLLIFLFNIIPVVSQSLTTVLGVFNYDKIRLLVYTATAQTLKYAVLILFFT